MLSLPCPFVPLYITARRSGDIDLCNCMCGLWHARYTLSQIPCLKPQYCKLSWHISHIFSNIASCKLLRGYLCVLHWSLQSCHVMYAFIVKYLINHPCLSAFCTLLFLLWHRIGTFIPVIFIELCYKKVEVVFIALLVPTFLRKNCCYCHKPFGGRGFIS